MSLLSGGTARPRVRLAPRAASNDGDDAVFLASSYGLVPDDWQEDGLHDWLGRRRDGRWAAATCGLAVPRQNGKNGQIEVRELFGMVALGEKFLHTAHEVKTARKAFLRIASFFENERQYPELAALAAEIRKTNGQEAVILTTGGSVEFIARSRGSGRGFTVDVLVCDEAQDLTDEELAALLPTISAAPTGNPQVILTGTPPDPEKAGTGEVFRRVRADGEAGRDKRLAWTDFGVPDGPLPDVDDRQLWRRVNPALGTRLNLAEVERERGLMSPEAFARERLGWWGDPRAQADHIFGGAAAWDDCAVELDQLPTDGLAIGIAVAWDRAHTSIGTAAPLGARILVGSTKRAPGTGWVVAEAARIQSQHGARVVLDNRGPSSDLIGPLREAGVTVDELGTNDVLNACARISDLVRDRGLAHTHTTDLDAAVAVAQKRPVGDRYAWGRKTSTGDVSMLEAVTLATWLTQPNPGDKLPAIFAWPAEGD